MKQEHIEQARHNAGFLAYLEESVPHSFYDWKVTVCFYQALHLVRAFLCSQGISDSISHDHTLNCINPNTRQKLPKHVPMPDVHPYYFRMHQLSMASRYSGFLQKQTFEQQQSDSLLKANECLAAIKQALTVRDFKWEPAQKKKVD